MPSSLRRSLLDYAFEHTTASWWLTCSPLFCGGWIYVTCLAILLMTLAFQVYSSFLSYQYAAFVQKHGASPLCGSVVSIAGAMFTFISVIRIVSARKLLTAEAVSTVRPASVSTVRLLSAEVGHHRSPRKFIAARKSILCETVCLVSGICWLFHDDDICYQQFLPMCLANVMGDAGGVVEFVADIGSDRVQVLVEKVGELNQGTASFHDVTADYFRLDTVLRELCAASCSVVGTIVGSNLTLMYMCIFCGVSIPNAGFRALLLFIAYVSLFGVVKVVWPLAKLSSMCQAARIQEGETPSLFAKVLECGMSDMSTEKNLEYVKFLQLVIAHPLGAELPLIGCITTSQIIAYGKIAVAAIPPLLTYAASAHGHDVKPC